MINNIFRRFISRLSSFAIGDGHGDTFFIRYDLIKTRWGSLYLHEFKRSDDTRCLHDHPWPFWTLILRGGYLEELRDPAFYIPDQYAMHPDGSWVTTKIWRPPGYFGRYPAVHAHRIAVDPGTPLPWSLVWVGRKERPWGFWTPAGWSKWAKGRGNPICENNS